jgi:xanthine dehydrogenase accessory factor
MKEIFGILLDRCREGLGTMLVTVIADSGSAPRGAGASMLVGEKGRLAGTVGGGMLEFEATGKAATDLAAGRGELVQYRLTKEGSASLGMVCGGDVDLLFTYVAPGEGSSRTLAALTERLDHHRPAWLLLPLDGLGLGFYSKDGGIEGLDIVPARGEPIDHTTSVIETSRGRCYTQKLVDPSRVFIFGGGHLAQELVPLLAHLGFRCVVTDDRPEFSAKELFPDAEEVHTLAYSDLGGRLEVGPRDYVVIVTRGHIGDYEAEKFALRSPAYYIGAVGSRAKIAAVNDKLRKDGFTDEDIARLTTPIGIDIKSETPAEIAVSIAAQLIERRAMCH